MNTLHEDDRLHDATGREEPKDPGPIQFTREELIEIEANAISEDGFITSLCPEQVKPAHLQARLAVLRSIQAKIAGEMEDDR